VVGIKPKLSTEDSLTAAVPAMTGAGDAAGAAAGTAAAAGAGDAAGDAAGSGIAAGALLLELAGAAAGELAALASAFALALVLLGALGAVALSLEFGSLAALAGANDITIAPSANKLAAFHDTFDNLIVASALHSKKNDRDRFGEDTSEECARRYCRHTRVSRESYDSSSVALRAPPPETPQYRAQMLRTL
jgi:hypothetical protein